ncbi:MAG: hypothetical protein LBL45_03435 [Treponema sp.]|nr:hypothetical protein [Treponema sp.]
MPLVRRHNSDGDSPLWTGRGLTRCGGNGISNGEVSNDPAVSIGSLLGAGIVIVGTVNTDGSPGRITVRALNTQTAQIITMSRDQF